MNDSEFNKCGCPHCGNNLEFTRELATTVVACPHCEGTMTLPAFYEKLEKESGPQLKFIGKVEGESGPRFKFLCPKCGQRMTFPNLDSVGIDRHCPLCPSDEDGPVLTAFLRVCDTIISFNRFTNKLLDIHEGECPEGRFRFSLSDSSNNHLYMGLRGLIQFVIFIIIAVLYSSLN